MSYSTYFPLDEVLARPRIRALRALRFFDWCSYSELSIACEVSDDPTAINTFCQGVSQAVKRGEIEKSRTGRGARYRITAKGRGEFAGVLADYGRAMESTYDRPSDQGPHRGHAMSAQTRPTLTRRSGQTSRYGQPAHSWRSS